MEKFYKEWIDLEYKEIIEKVRKGTLCGEPIRIENIDATFSVKQSIVAAYYLGAFGTTSVTEASKFIRDC